jgi:hypothetical protein
MADGSRECQETGRLALDFGFLGHFPVLRTGFSILKTVFSILRNGFSILKTVFSILRNGFSILRNGFSILITEFSILRNGFSILRNEFSILRNEFSVLGQLTAEFSKRQIIKVLLGLWLGGFGCGWGGLRRHLVRAKNAKGAKVFADGHHSSVFIAVLARLA